MMDLKEELAALIGAEKVSDSEADLEVHSVDKWFHHHPPEVVVFAESTDDVAAVLRFAHEHEIPVTPRGAGVGYVGGAVPVAGGISLSVARMKQIKEISAADGVAVVEPGVITGDLLAAAREVGFFYPPDPASLKECSIGGNVATNAGGPRCLKYGVTRHYILGLEVVLADGTIAKLGGRCHKNKTGFDLIGMFVGSEGMLGIITEITARLIPNPPARAMLSAGFAEFSEAAAAVDGVLGAGFLPAALEISDKFTLAAARAHVGGEMVPRGEAHVLIELDGQADSVLLDCRALERKLGQLGALGVSTADTEDGCEALWDIRRAFSYSLRATGLTKLNEDIVVPRGKLTELVGFC
ncbi:MAG: FAD-binding oxidoreductase, partial [Verrucomicrobiales bacterium]